MSKNSSTIRTVIVLVVTTILILVGLWLVQKPWQNAGDDPAASGTAGALSTVDTSIDPGQAAPQVDGEAPNFTVATTVGDKLVLEELEGKPVWLVFGATWCTNCRAEAPDVHAVAQAMEGRAHVINIYIGEDLSTVQAYAERLKLTNPQVADSASTIGSEYGVMGIPAHYFIDAEGVIREIVVGTVTQQAATEKLEALGA